MIEPQLVLRSGSLRDLERLHGNAQPSLMERAGAAGCGLALQLIAGSLKPPLILAGPGNNGGDALVVARLLKQQGLEPVLVFAGAAEKLPTDARIAHDAWLARGGTLLTDIPAGDYGIIIDGLLGIGLGNRPLEGRLAALVERINKLGGTVLALDIPSGIDSETGQVRGAAVRATHTATFVALKPGLLTLDGPDHCGAVTVSDLGLNVNPADGSTVALALFADRLQARRKNSHKGSYGSAGIVGGAPGMTGAALLAGSAALKLGAGRVYLGMLEKLAVDPSQPELMLRTGDEVLALATCVAVGPGLGQSAAALTMLRRAIDSDLPLLLDADALNLLAGHPVLAAKIARRSAPTLLTPHPAEAARLLGCDVAMVQADRVAAAVDLARRFKAPSVLKGCGSVIAFPDGRWFINTTGNPGLSSAGTGDVLSGMAVALLAQGWPADQALLAAVHLHGAAADACLAAAGGPIGLTAGELIGPARKLFNNWITASTSLHD